MKFLGIQPIFGPIFVHLRKRDFQTLIFIIFWQSKLLFCLKISCQSDLKFLGIQPTFRQFFVHLRKRDFQTLIFIIFWQSKLLFCLKISCQSDLKFLGIQPIFGPFYQAQIAIWWWPKILVSSFLTYWTSIGSLLGYLPQ